MPPDFARPDPEDLADAAAEVVDCMRVLGKSGSNIVLEALGGHDFVELEHYPPGDVRDPQTHSQFYFHAHPASPTREADFGHFHTFLRPGALPADAALADLPGNPVDRDPTAVTAHLVAISMDRYGRPTALFTTNRWVTDETVYPADVLIPALPAFEMDVAHPSWPLNRWITAMMTLYRSEIAALLRQRDEALARHGSGDAGADVLNDRALEVTSRQPIDLEAKLVEVRHLAGLT
ncbi:DUF6969 family protein [Caenispirillum salinarum]|uniref:DUF6969 family protein n=1 Tax=Caenispirillum salinarum TaxID=859058 RepID=UPI00384E1B1B